MDKHDDEVPVPWVSGCIRDVSVSVDGETLDDNLGCGVEDGGEIMVEVVGSDVFVDGVGGGEMGGNDNLGVPGDGDDRVREGGVGIRVDGLEEITGLSGEKVDVVKRDEDVEMEEVRIVANEGVVKVAMNDGGLERGKQVTERDHVNCMLATLFAREDSDIHGDAMNCSTKIVEEDVKIVVFDDDFEKREEGLERDGVSCILTTTSIREDTDMHGDSMICASGVVEEDAKVAATEDALVRGENVIERVDVSCVLATTSAHEDNEMLGDAVNCDTQVVEEDVKIVANEDSENCEKMTERNGVSCILTTTSIHEDTDMHGDSMNCASGVVEEDVKVVATEDALVRGENVIERDAASCALATTSAHEDSEMLGDDVNVAGELSAGDTFMVTGSSNGPTRIVADELASVANEDARKEAVISLGEVLENPHIGALSDEASDAHAFDDKVSLDKSTETAKGTGLGEGEGDGYIGEGTLSSIDLVSTIEHTQIATVYSEGIDNKVVNPDREVISEEHKILTTESESMLIENTDCAGKNEPTVEALCESSRSDIVLCSVSDPEPGGKQILADSKLILNDSLLANNLAEVSVTTVESCGTTYRDAGKDVEQINIPKTDVSGVSYKEATDSKVRRSVADASNGNLSSYARDLWLNVERETVDNSSEIDVALGLYPVCSSQENHDIGTNEAAVMNCNVADSNMEVPTTDMDAISGSEDIQGPEGDLDFGIPECVDASSTGNFARVSLDQDHISEVEEYNAEKQVELHKMQVAEVQDEAMEIEQSDDFDKKNSEQVSPRFGSLFSGCHSHYLRLPKTGGEFSDSDLVWGKVRSHPWWPGQICNPDDASVKAMKYHKRDCFLVAYFGDRTFAWNDASLLRPFRSHISQIEKQSNSEAFYHAVSCALAEVSRRVELGLACSCIPEKSLVEIESQIIENAGIRQEASRRYGVDDSTAASCFEPGELLEHIRSLALFPSAGSDVLLQLVISKAQLSAFSRFKGQSILPEFQLCGGLLEKDANTHVIQQHSEQIKGKNNFSSKRKHDCTDSLLSRKKDRSMSDLIDDKPHSSDGEDEFDSNIEDTPVASSAGRKRKAHDSVTNGSDKRQRYYAAKVSATASQTPKPSFKVGECIRRVASQLTGSPTLVKCNSEKFLRIDHSVEQHPGFDDALQTHVISQSGRMMLSPEHSSLDEMLSQLYLAAQDPMKGYSFLNNITSFFSDFRHSVASGQNSRMRNLSTGRGGRKKKAPHSIIKSPEDFEFDDVNDSYWTDRIVQNYNENQLLNSAQNGEAEYQLVLHQADKPLKSGRRSRKQFSNGEHLVVAEEPIADHIDRKQDCLPMELILNFAAGHAVPTELNLNKIFRRFGPLQECETEVDRETRRARVVYKRFSDAEVALNSAGKFNIFGPMHVNYELSYVPSAPYKPLPVAALEGEINAS